MLFYLLTFSSLLKRLTGLSRKTNAEFAGAG